MYYFDYVRLRGSLKTYAIVLACFVVFVLGSIPFSHTGHNETTFGVNGESIRLHDFSGYALVHTFGRTLDIPFTLLCTIAVCIAIVYATTFGSSLSRVNQHLHLWFTRPVSRERAALVTIGLDAITIAIGFAIALVALLIPIAATGLLDRIRFDGDAWIAIAAGLSVGYMWYAMLQAVTAGLRSKAGVVLGLSWPLFIGLRALHHLDARYVPSFLVWIFDALNTIDPFSYVSSIAPSHGIQTAAERGIAIADFATIWVTIVVSIAVAIAIRKRMEA